MSIGIKRSVIIRLAVVMWDVWITEKTHLSMQQKPLKKCVISNLKRNVIRHLCIGIIFCTKYMGITGNCLLLTSE